MSSTGERRLPADPRSGPAAVNGFGGKEAIVAPLLGREDLLEEAAGLLARGQSVLLFGPPEVGKSAVVVALTRPGLMVLDPFEGVTPHRAARIRRAIGRGEVHLAAARSLDRPHLGAVRRIMFWFTPVRVPPLANRWISWLIRREGRLAGISEEEMKPTWLRAMARLVRGRPGVAIALGQTAAELLRARGTLPLPATIHIEALLRRFTLKASRE